MKMQKEWLDFLREQYPIGSRIKLREMGPDDPNPIKPGSMGTLQCIDDAGGFLVKWDDGRDLGLVIGQDSFSVLPPPLHTLKLYMPMTASYWDDDGCTESEYTLNSRELVGYAPQIMAALERERRSLIAYGESHGTEEPERGLMAGYSEDDGVERKVHSYWFSAEVRDGRLWGVAECRVRGELTPEELEQLIQDVGGSASDGFGEHLEQQEIRVGDGLELYAHLWQSDGWTIMPERDRFDSQFSQKLPALCWAAHPDDGSLVYILRGQEGYHPSKWNQEIPEANRNLANYRNRERGISEAQVQAMLGGCQIGWDSPAADPSHYEQKQSQMGGMDFA